MIKFANLFLIFVSLKPYSKSKFGDITFILKVDAKSSRNRLKKRRTKNRYDNFPQSFYRKAQSSFLKIAKNKKNYFVLNSSHNDNRLEKEILKIVLKYLKIYD